MTYSKGENLANAIVNITFMAMDTGLTKEEFLKLIENTWEKYENISKEEKDKILANLVLNAMKKVGIV